MTFRTVVRTMAYRNGLFADFSPKPLEDQPGNGFHINISHEKYVICIKFEIIVVFFKKFNCFFQAILMQKRITVIYYHDLYIFRAWAERKRKSFFEINLFTLP